jgi:signal peptidase I
LVSSTLASCSDAKKTVVGAPLSMTYPLNVDSDAMAPTIVRGQTIDAEPLLPGTYTPHRQDIVVIHPTADYENINLSQSDMIVRRVIGLPGDKVSCDGQGSPLLLNGAALHEPYLYKGDAPSMIAFDVKIPPGSLWLLADHRNIGIDSRWYAGSPDQGAIPISNVVGLYIKGA